MTGELRSEYHGVIHYLASLRRNGLIRRETAGMSNLGSGATVSLLVKKANGMAKYDTKFEIPKTRFFLIFFLRRVSIESVC